MCNYELCKKSWLFVQVSPCKNPWLVFIATCWAFTPLVFSYARLERELLGLDVGVGGELFFPLLPLLIYLIARTVSI